MRKPTEKQRARAGLSLALRNLHAAETEAEQYARDLAACKKPLAHLRRVARLAVEDARKAGVL